MGTFIFFLFIGLPVAEILVLARVGGRIGFWNTFALLIFSAVLGGYLAKAQGKIVLSRIQQCLAEGRTPTTEMLDGLLIFLGGLLFIFPGFVSDGIGLLLVFPLTRWLMRSLVLIGVRSQSGSTRAQPPRQTRDQEPPNFSQGAAEDAQIIE